MAEKHKDFACGACGAEFDTREALESHNEREHQRTGQSGGASTSQKPNDRTGEPKR